MDMNSPSDGSTRTGTLGGTVLVILLQLDMAQLLETIVLAAVGAAVSFMVSILMKWLVQKLKSK